MADKKDINKIQKQLDSQKQKISNGSVINTKDLHFLRINRNPVQDILDNFDSSKVVIPNIVEMFEGMRQDIKTLVDRNEKLEEDKIKLKQESSKSEIDIAKELQKIGHLEGAGITAGLTIEKNLKKVAKNREIKLPKNPTMKHYNEALKSKAYDATMTKRVELCINIRNRCAHASDNPPTDDEVNIIISSAEIIIATVN